MTQQVCQGALLACSFGTAPANLGVLPTNQVMTNAKPAANIMDNKPMVNIPSFGLCASLANPAVAAATSAAMGVLTPMPCVPNTPAPWTPGVPTVLIAGQPALDNSCKLSCVYAGVIQVTFAGQTNHIF